MGDGVSVELCDGFHPFHLCHQFVVTLHLHNSLVEDRSIRVIAGDHLGPCWTLILSFPCCGRRALQSHLNCTSEKVTDSASTPGQLSLISEIQQINKPAKPTSVYVLPSYKMCSFALELLRHRGSNSSNKCFPLVYAKGTSVMLEVMAQLAQLSEPHSRGISLVIIPPFKSS